MTLTIPEADQEQDEQPTVFDRARDVEQGYTKTPQTEALNEILDAAVAYDQVCGIYQKNLYDRIAFHGGTTAANLDDGELTAYRLAVSELCAIIAPAALRHVPADDLLAKGLSHVLFERAEDDNGARVEALIRSIFRESGIEHRFAN